MWPGLWNLLWAFKKVSPFLTRPHFAETWLKQNFYRTPNHYSNVSTFSKPHAASIKIELKNLRFFANHGWHDEEAVLGNEFEVTLTATFPAKERINSIDDTVDYTKIYTLVKTVFLQREKLLETVAQNIAAAIEKEFTQMGQLQITITKLNPVIASFIGTVGITYTKDFTA